MPPGRPGLPDVDAVGREHLARTATERRQRGAYYTPLALARAVVQRALSPFGRALPSAILDPACGCGAFLVAALAALQDRGLRSAEAASRLFGVDTDARAAALARRCLVGAGAAPMGRRVRRGDGLVGPWPGPDRYDLIVGNPPHLGEEDHRAVLAAARSATGLRAPRGDLSYHFASRALDLLSEHGVLAMILPGSLADADSAAALRARLASETRVHAAIDLGSGAVFGAGIGQPTMLVLARKGSRPGPCQHLGWRSEPTPEQVVTAVDGRAPRNARVWRSTAPVGRDGARWPRQPAARTRAPKRGTARLGERFQVHQGVVPGPACAGAKAVARLLRERGEEASPACVRAWAANRGFDIGEGVFVLDRDEAARLLDAGVPAALLRPFARPRAISGPGCPRDRGDRLLYLTASTCPGLGAHPALARHLERFRPLLERRRETRLGLRAWFHLHWPRDEALFLDPRVLVPRQCRAPVAAYCTRPLFTDLGCNVITGGDRTALQRLARRLCSPAVAEWLHGHGKRKAGTLQIDARILEELPISVPE